MDALTLLRRAHDAGLRVKPVGDQLLVQGPRRAELLVRLLAAHKAEVMVALTEADERARPASRKCRAAVGAEYWRDLFDERAAHREFDGGYSRADAERLAFGEMILEWHRLLGVPPEPNHCAGCGDELPGEGGLYLCDGAYGHFDGVRGVDCIVKYGKKCRGLQSRPCACSGSTRRKGGEATFARPILRLRSDTFPGA